MRRSQLLLVPLASLTVCSIGLADVATPRFELRPSAEHVYTGGWEHFVGGGVAAFDCNGDSLPELFAAGGSNSAQLFVNESDPGGRLSFRSATPDSLAITSVIGAYPLDIDNDAILDLVVLRVGENLLLRGQGDCQFEPFADIGFNGGDRWTTAFSATWETGQDLPTLAIGNYVDRDDPDGPFEACDSNELWRPADNRYTDPTVLDPGFCALSMLFSDWGRQGRADLRVSNDRHYFVRDGEEQLWAMEAVPRLFTEEEGWNSHQLWGMGIASRDLDGDGLSEVYLTSMGDQRLQALAAEETTPSFVDAPFESGTTAHRPYTGGDGRPSTGWHAAFGDVQNDGFADLFVAKGNVEQMPGSAMDDPNNLLLGTPQIMSFQEAGLEAGIATMDKSRGAVLTDLNLDGLEDLVVVNRGAAMEIYQNRTEPAGRWLQIVPGQADSNRFAIGAHVEVRTGEIAWTQELTVGGGHAGGVSNGLHFGLGDAVTAEVRVVWPDGEVGDWQSVATNQRVHINRR